jgi:monoterpene epsilon-lactone hydrolase
MADPSPPRRPPVGVSRLAARLLGRFVLSSSLTFEQQRGRLGRFLGANGAPKGTTATTRRIAGLEVAQRSAAGSAPDRVVLHLHGGGYCIGEPAMAHAWAGLLADAAAATVLLPDYPLAPEAPFPRALDQVAGVWEELTATVAPSRIVLSGDSAGGGLAVALAARLRDQGAPPPAGLLLLSPWLDLTVDRHADADLVRRDPMLDPDWLAACASAYAGGTDLADPGVSPLLGSVAGLPPALVQSGADDVLVGDSIRFARDVGASGGEVVLSIANGLWHIFPMQAGMLAAADGAVRQAAAFIGRAVAADQNA